MKKEIRTKLRNRAIAMAHEHDKERVVSEVTEVIAFTLAAETYAVESAFVREVYPMKDFTPLPGIPQHILGIINLRGQILPVLDLKKFFNLPEKGLGELNKVIIIRDDNMEFGILADVVHGNQSVENDEIQDLPPTVSPIGDEYLKGVTKDGLIILNAGNLLADKKIVVNEGVG